MKAVAWRAPWQPSQIPAAAPLHGKDALCQGRYAAGEGRHLCPAGQLSVHPQIGGGQPTQGGAEARLAERHHSIHKVQHCAGHHLRTSGNTADGSKLGLQCAIGL